MIHTYRFAGGRGGGRSLREVDIATGVDGYAWDLHWSYHARAWTGGEVVLSVTLLDEHRKDIDRFQASSRHEQHWEPEKIISFSIYRDEEATPLVTLRWGEFWRADFWFITRDATDPDFSKVDVISLPGGV